MIRIFLAVLLLSSLAARAEDAEGCKDPKVLQRYPGSAINSCDKKEYDELDLPMSFTKDEGSVRKTVGGQVERYSYTIPENVSELQIARNIENALEKQGFKILVGRKVGAACCEVTAQLKDLVLSANVGGGATDLILVKLKEMEQKIEADASGMLDELNKSGHVAVYGINFETGKAGITEDSGKVLEQVQKLLADNADLKLRIEGHTDDAGKAKANLDLSKKRAAAVKEWLVKHGVEAARLTTEGYGSSKPVGDNKTDEGKAKNRRVELVKL